eukprot:m.85188 g.85188  ORF g.85188 m.85188 type:complete len:348 (-) comp25844_c0_seq1:31-1074(-)
MDVVTTIWRTQAARKYVMLLAFMSTWTLATIAFAHRRNCTALLAFAFWCARDVLLLLKRLLIFWIEGAAATEKSENFTFGFDRFQVLTTFGFAIAIVLGALYTVKESVSQAIVQAPMHFDDLFVWTCATLVVHAMVSHVAEKPGLVVAVIRILRLRNRRSLPDDAQLYELMSCVVLLIAMLFIETTDAALHMDTVAAVVIALLLVLSAIPDIHENGIILVQNIATANVNQLHKCIREMSTFEGVLEFFNIHFWTVSPGKLAGTIHVRVRRDANEQIILAQVANKLAHLIKPSNLAVQIVKDDWMSSTMPMSPRPFDLLTPSRECSTSSMLSTSSTASSLSLSSPPEY